MADGRQERWTRGQAHLRSQGYIRKPRKRVSRIWTDGGTFAGHASTQILPTYVKPIDEKTRALIEALNTDRSSHTARIHSIISRQSSK